MSAGEPLEPGFRPRPDPPSGFQTLLTVSSPPHLPSHGNGAAHGVHPAEPFPSMEPYAFRRRCPLAVSGIACSCSEDQKFTMPRSSRALLPTEVRTCDGRPPVQADALMGVLRLSRAIPARMRTRLPGPVPPALCPPGLGETEPPALQGIDTHAGRQGSSRNPPTLVRFSTRTCPRIAPDDSGVLSE